MDNFITTLIVQLYEDNESREQQFRDSVIENMRLRAIKDRRIDDLMTIQSKGNQLTINLDYEERQHLFYNIDVVIHFKKTYMSEQPTIYGNQ